MEKENLEGLNDKQSDKIYKSKDILDSAVRANVKLDDVKEVAVLFDKSNEKNGDVKDEVRK